jgi:hypothetical protein
MWQIRYSPRATAGIYTIPRGVAGAVTAAIKALVNHPLIGEPVPGQENTYKLQVEGYTVEYRLVEQHDPQLIVLLNIE